MLLLILKLFLLDFISLIIVEQAIREAKGEEGISWSVSQIKAYFGLSGGYNLCKLVDHFNNRGLYRALFLSIDFAAALQRLGAQAELILFDGKTHTDLFLQDPLRGGKDEMFSHLVAVIHAGDEEALAKDATAPPRRRLVPEVLLRMASHISPF
ncbi:isoprenylcysteine alpha-carbonyl methylesterase ICME-like [Populus alba x Populus x berolinensis]|nr:isoprenylcysteine alpha-carbonyl methylesterase ICME-like [Populus alba x Populus x berolinensis]